MKCKTLKKQFQTKNFCFGGDDQECESFYESQWCNCQIAFFIYRLVMALNSLGWTIGFYAWCSVYCEYKVKYSYRYITLWADFLRTVYFISGALLMVASINTKIPPAPKDKDFLKGLRMSTWFFHGMALSSNLAVAAFFWAFVAPNLEPEVAGETLNVYMHAVNAILMIIDLFVVKFPIRLLHFVYSSALALVYGFSTFIMWKVGDTHAIYAVLDWEQKPGSVIGFFMASAFIGAPLSQLLGFGLYLLRIFCYETFKKTIPDPNENLENISLKKDYQSD